MDSKVLELAQQWTGESFDAETRSKVQHLMDNDPKELDESFYKSLEFGTGGLRGIMGVGTNRINIYTVGMATQGLANYLKASFEGHISIAIAHDSRNNSALFARKTAEIFSANGIKAYLFSSLRPTPELSFAIRELGCKSGVVVTASHNPKEYNGYKVYWDDGGQLVPPHDGNVINEVSKITGPDLIKWTADESLIEMIDEEIDEKYLAAVDSLCLSPDAVKAKHDLGIVFTSIHGTGVTMVPKSLARLGFTNVHTVKEQDAPDGNFPTVVSPNPEEAAALDMALTLANDVNADLVMGCDPDSDRVGIAVRDNEGKMILLNGNQTGALLVNYLVTRWRELGKLDGNQFVCKTIVTSDLLTKISTASEIPVFNVLTGFKYIAQLIKEYEGKMQFIGGGEESYGYLAGDLVRDKDAILSCTLIAEMCAWAANDGKSLYNLLLDIYVEHGLFVEDLVSITKKGKEGASEIAQMMEDLRNNPPSSLGGSAVATALDYKLQTKKSLANGEVNETGLPSSNVLQFITEDGSVITARPSGTEPKIKFYFSVNGPMNSKEEYTAAHSSLKAKIEAIKADLGI
ncbi:MAG: phosphoglucomutase [Flavobacteriales bacterium]|jgi:phosphoglucomutase